jgi:hypothetical protein
VLGRKGACYRTPIGLKDSKTDFIGTRISKMNAECKVSFDSECSAKVQH